MQAIEGVLRPFACRPGHRFQATTTHFYSLWRERRLSSLAGVTIPPRIGRPGRPSWPLEECSSLVNENVRHGQGSGQLSRRTWAAIGLQLFHGETMLRLAGLGFGSMLMGLLREWKLRVITLLVASAWWPRIQKDTATCM
jgi:hypothetical protein